MLNDKTRLTTSYALASLLIVGGGIIYVCYRPLSLWFFFWVGASEKSKTLMSIRSAAPDIPGWCIYALPDGLWAVAYGIFIGAIWNFEYPACISVAMLIPAIGIVSEFLQAFHLLPGTFDWVDLTMYFSGGLLAWAYIYAAHRLTENNKK